MKDDANMPSGQSMRDDLGSLNDRVRRAASTAAEHVQDGLSEVAANAELAAESIENVVHEARESVAEAGRRASRAVTLSATRVRQDGRVRAVKRRADAFLQDHPGKLLLAFAAVGFVLGRTMTRKR